MTQQEIFAGGAGFVNWVGTVEEPSGVGKDGENYFRSRYDWSEFLREKAGILSGVGEISANFFSSNAEGL